ncbi:uncharacterized protein LOC125876513 [Solanum stenotomum]|uniref:uncharacterized protein LOC125876513 n=1 Tax=Solanum stenotomum TaxID=172797 RepID=UPI0020D10AD4|nr:uncharacterized protein LOC125876513 [Solanum stenotomum]
MKKKFCLCYCPCVVETEDSTDLLLSTNNNSTVSSSMNIFVKDSDKKITNPSFNKSIHKHPTRKIFSYKNFPRLCKAILFQDPLRNIQQLEIELKSKVNWNKDEQCFKKLENHESRKPEMEVEEVNKISQEKDSSVSHESQKLSSSNWTNPKTSSTTSTSSCDKKKKDYCSLLYLIVIALFMTIFLGKSWAIVLTLSWLYSIPYYQTRQQ